MVFPTETIPSVTQQYWGNLEHICLVTPWEFLRIWKSKFLLVLRSHSEVCRVCTSRMLQRRKSLLTCQSYRPACAAALHVTGLRSTPIASAVNYVKIAVSVLEKQHLQCPVNWSNIFSFKYIRLVQRSRKKSYGWIRNCCSLNLIKTLPYLSQKNFFYSKI